MRVVLFTGRFLPDVGGMEYAVHYLAQALAACGVDVTVMAKRSRKSATFSHKYRLIRYGYTFRGAHLLRVNHLSAMYEISKLHGNQPIDLINFHNVARPPQYGLSFCIRKGLPVVMTPHGQDIQRVEEIGYGLRLDLRWDRRIQRHIGQANAVTAISESVRRELDFVSPDKVFLVPNGIHVQRFARAPTHYLHERLKLAPRCRIILSVGRNHIKKGYEYGIRAVARLREECNDIDFCYVVIGRGVTQHANLVETLELQKHVNLIEEVESAELARCYNSSWIFFSPSIVEGLSLVGIEAMACGLPLVVTDVPGNFDIVRDNPGCGIIVGSKDIEDMARGLHRLITDPGERERRAGIAFEHSAKYDWSKIAERYLDVYRSVIKAADQAKPSGLSSGD